jgi:hypothetical protein
MIQPTELKSIPISKFTNPEAWAGQYLDYASMTNDVKALVLHSDVVEHEYIRMILANILNTKGIDGCSNQELSFLAHRVSVIKRCVNDDCLSLEKIAVLFFDNIILEDFEIADIINAYDFYSAEHTVRIIEL